MFSVRKFLVALATLLVSLALLGAGPAAAEGTDPRSMEVDFIDRINVLRSQHGLAPLAEDRSDLSAVARSWAESMAAAGSISHRPDLVTAAPADWARLGENVGLGSTVASLHDAFVASPLHLKNLVDPQFDSIGVGIVVRDGLIWITQNFMRAAPAGTAPAMSAASSSGSGEVLSRAPAKSTKACATRRCKATKKAPRRGARRAPARRR